jgi:hypothetical protein
MTQTVSQQLTGMRLLMRQKFYSNQQYTDLLLQDMEQQFDCTNISFDSDNMIIDIKIKKTAMKRQGNFSHDVTYYYPFITNAFDTFIGSIRPELEECASTTGYTYEMIRDNCLSLFNATTLLDNMIRISL